jgi:hypothetical protein
MAEAEATPLGTRRQTSTSPAGSWWAKAMGRGCFTRRRTLTRPLKTAIAGSVAHPNSRWSWREHLVSRGQSSGALRVSQTRLRPPQRPPSPRPSPRWGEGDRWTARRGRIPWAEATPSPSLRRGEGARRADEGVRRPVLFGPLKHRPSFGHLSSACSPACVRGDLDPQFARDRTESPGTAGRRGRCRGAHQDG